MTEHTPNLTMQLRAQDDPAARQAYVQKWIARNQRRLAAGLGSAVLMLPLLAQAQAQALVNALDIAGVNSVALNPDGSAQLTLSNGQQVQVGASSVQVAADGTIQISAAAAELVAEVVGSIAAAGTGAAGAGGAAGIGVAAAGLGIAVAAASGSSSSESAPAPLPVLNAGALTGASPVTAQAVFGSFPDLPDGDQVFVTIGDGDEVSVTIGADGTIIFPAGLDLSGVQGEQTISFRVERSSTVEGVDEDGNPTSEIVTEDVATGTAQVVIDTVPPTLTITTPIAGDDVLNAAEQGEDLEISGTTDAEDGQVVTVSFNGQEYEATVADGAWSLTIPAADLAGLADGASLAITADVSDVAGNPATQATATLATDFTAGITLDPVVIETLNTFTGVTVEGTTTGVEAGREVTLSFNGTEYTGAVGADGSWSIDIPAAVIDALEDGAEIAISAAVSDAAGNADTASATSTTDFSQPALVITTPATGGVINAEASDTDIVVSGIALAGQEVTVTLNGTEQTVTADAGNNWSTTFPASALPDDDGPVTITATTTIDGTAITAPAVTLTLDTTPPVLSISPIAGDNVLNAAEQGADLVIAGSATGAEDGQEVRVTFAGGVYRVPVSGEAWSVTIPAETLAGLADGESFVIGANVSDAAGNPATQVTATLATDFTAGITLDPVVIETLNTFTGVTVTGDTDGVEEGQEVLINFAGQEFATTVGADGTWSVEIPAATIDALDDATEVAISAAVSDLAGNQANASASTTTDFSQPALAITSPADGGFINAEAAGDDIVVSGSALAGQEVTVTLNGTEQTVTADAGNNWSTTFPATALPDDDGPVTINATTTIDGTAINAPAVTLTLDTTAPTLTLESATTEAGLVLSGTTSDDVDAVALMVGGESFTAQAEGGAWSLTIAPADLPAAAAGATVPVTANAADRAGNTAPEATLSLTAAEVTITAPAAGFIAGLDEFEGGLPISGTSTGVAEGANVTITLTEGVSVMAPVGADGSWSVTALPATVQGLDDQSDFTLTASATGESYPSLASATVGISTDFPPEITLNPIGEDGALILTDLGGTLDVSGTTRGAPAGQEVSIRSGETELGTGTVGADGSWTATIPTPSIDSGETFTVSAVVQNAAGRTADATTSAVGYEAADYMVMGATTVAAGAAAGALEFTFFLDPRYEPAADFGIAFGETMRFDTDVASWAPSPAPQYLAGLTPAVNSENAATGTVIFGGVGFLNPEDPETGEAVDLYSQRLIRFRLNHDDTDAPIVLTFESQVGGNYDFVLGTDAADTLTAGLFDATIRGRGGNDMIDVSAAGVNTVIFEGGSVANGFDTITGFTLGGALADRFSISFDTFDQDVLRGDGSAFQLSDGGAVGANVGLLVFTTAVADFENATIEAALSGLTGLEAGDSLYVLIGNGTDAELTTVGFDGTDVSVSSDSGTSYARFEGIGDLSGFSAANIIGFEQHNV